MTLRTDRSLHLIDIENLAGARHRSLKAVSIASDAYRASVRIGPSDQVIIGCNDAPDYRLHVGLIWKGRRIVSGAGSDGADRALLAATDVHWIHNQGFARVFIGSGDHAFAPLALSLRSLHIPVTVIARMGVLSSRLRNAANSHQRLSRISLQPVRAEAA